MPPERPTTPITEPFDQHTDRYETWFERYEPAYRAELRALDRLVDESAFGVEVGVGTGRFAGPLGLELGVDPSIEMLALAADVDRTLREARRVLRPGGRVVLGYVDRDSPLGRTYLEKQDENLFYQDAEFHTTDDLRAALEAAGFGEMEFVQTIFSSLSSVSEAEPIEAGYGDGSFVGLAASVPE